jgi:uncharacterized protein YndB with AHSA1/START domain
MVTKAKRSTSISDSAVEAKTGKTWLQWFSLLDKAGAKKLDHKQIVAVLRDQCGVGPWWQQMVTVEYERSRGLREKHQTAGGYVANASKTFGVSLETLYEAWRNPRVRGRWLGEKGIAIRSETPPKVIRMSWSDGVSRVEVRFTAKGAAKSQVAVDHAKLANAKAVAKMKTFWAAAFGRLQELLVRL